MKTTQLQTFSGIVKILKVRSDQPFVDVLMMFWVLPSIADSTVSGSNYKRMVNEEYVEPQEPRRQTHLQNLELNVSSHTATKS